MKIIFIILVTILGLILGSFYCCMGYRIPNKIKLSKPRSFCPKCKNTIKWYMNIPVFSYLFLKGKCAYCKEKISPIYILVEITTSILFLLFYLKFGFNTNFYLAVTLISVFSVTLVSDLLYYYVSDRVVVLATFSTLLILIIFSNIGNIIYSIISAVTMFLLIYLVKIIGDKVFKKESMGGGDIKLLGLIGLILGFIPSLLSLIIACVLGLIFSLFYLRKKENIIPFGPFLLLGALIILYLIPNSNLILF